MHEYVQNSTNTTFPRRSAAVSGRVLSQPLAPSKGGDLLSVSNRVASCSAMTALSAKMMPTPTATANVVASVSLFMGRAPAIAGPASVPAGPIRLAQRLEGGAHLGERKVPPAPTPHSFRPSESLL
jgi:hypothetical protein